MRAIVKPAAAPGLTLQDVPDPGPPGPGEVLVRVRRAGICGTDLHIHQWDQWASARVKPPVILGHEFMGEVAAVGESVEGIEIGDRVSAEGHAVCGHCDFCKTGQGHVCRDTRIIGIDRDGAFADMVVIPEENIIHVPAVISSDHAALLDPLGNAFHTVMHRPVSGRVVTISGCGPIGLFAVGIARAAGAARVIAIEPQESRRALAGRMGAHLCLDPRSQNVAAEVAGVTRGYGADIVCEMSGHADGVSLALEICRNGGHVQLLGIPRRPLEIDLGRDIIFKGLHIYGVVGRLMYDTWTQMRDFLAAGLLDIDPVITHRLPFERFQEGIDAMRAGEAAKVVLALD